MNTKAIIAINAAWATAAAGMFFLGKSQLADTKAERELAAAAEGAPGSVSALAGGSGSGSKESGAATGGSGSARVTAENAESSMAAALADKDPLRRKARIAELLVNLTPEQVPGMLAAFENGERNDETNRLFRDFLYSWGRVGGKDAIDYMMDPESKRRDHYGGTSAIAGWAAVDKQGAKDYVAATENKHAKEWLHYGVFREELRSDLDGAIAYSEENFLSRARGRQMDLIRDEIFRRDGIAGLTDWVAGIDHTNTEGNDLLAYKRYASTITLDRMASEDPAAALSWITEHGDQPYVTADGLERVARRAGGPIGEELDWLAALPDTVSERRHALGERFEDYIREDFEAAGQWLAGQELGPAYDEAIQDYARSAARDDPEAAMAWANRITDPRIRQSTIDRIAPRVNVQTIFTEQGS